MTCFDHLWIRRIPRTPLARGSVLEVSATGLVALEQPLWPRADGTPNLLERQTEGLAQDVRAELHTCAKARLEPVLDGLPQVNNRTR